MGKMDNQLLYILLTPLKQNCFDNDSLLTAIQYRRLDIDVQ